ncbi:MAG: ABC transporter permease [Phycisphaerae bacterium]|nr:ABC transporter permease [Phycisphaerae bacterium]
MTSFIIRRILISLLLLWGASLMGFSIMKAAPGDYFDRLKMDTRVSTEYIEQLRQQYRFDDSVLTQYGAWLWNFVHLDFGYSFEYKLAVSKVIGDRLVNTLILNIFAVFLTWSIAIPIGIYAAVRQYSLGDKILSGLAFVGMSLPSFFSALLLLYIFSAELNWLPSGGLRSVNHDELSPAGRIADYAKHLVIPVVVLSFMALAGLQRITRGNMLEVLRQQYITTARAKGLSEHRVIYKHALRNAVNPLITIFGYQFSAMLSGAALLEIIINYPGLGSMMLTAVRSQDQFLVMGGFMMAAVMLLIGNLLAEILLAIVDPRISYS